MTLFVIIHVCTIVKKIAAEVKEKYDVEVVLNWITLVVQCERNYDVDSIM